MSNKISSKKALGDPHSDVASSPPPKSSTKLGSKKYPNDDDRRAPSDMRKKDLVAALANEKENVKNLEAKVKQLERAPGGIEVSHVERSELQDQREDVFNQQETLLTQQKAVLKQEQAALRKEKAEVTETKERLKEKEKLLEWGFDEQEGVERSNRNGRGSRIGFVGAATDPTGENGARVEGETW